MTQSSRSRKEESKRSLERQCWASNSLAWTPLPILFFAPDNLVHAPNQHLKPAWIQTPQTKPPQSLFYPQNLQHEGRLTSQPKVPDAKSPTSLLPRSPAQARLDPECRVRLIRLHFFRFISWTCPVEVRAETWGRCQGCSPHPPRRRLRSLVGSPSWGASGIPRRPAPWPPSPQPPSPPSSWAHTEQREDKERQWIRNQKKPLKV